MEEKDKTIEIPFGAQDSELRGFEYTIPDGFEAEIRDGKVIVRKAEIERRMKKWDNLDKDLLSKNSEFGRDAPINRWCELKDLLSFIESLEKERPKKINVTGDDFSWIDELKHGLEHPEELDKKVAEALKNRGNFPKSNTNSQKGIVYQAINEIMGGHTPEKLAECNQTIFKVAMRALEIQLCDDHDLSEAFKAGAEWQKEQMMKDAVECVVCAGMEGNKWIMSYIGDYESIVKTCKAGDKVRIIIVKEESK